MSESSSPSGPDVTSIDCPHCGSKGYVLQSTLTDKKSEVRIYLCGECGKRTEITVID
jgi:transcription elongation factor Elf1